MSFKAIPREVVPGQIWALTKPFLRFGAKVGGRASIIKLGKGDLFVISPVPLEEDTKEWINSIGIVKYIAAPDLEHYLSLKPWAEAFPEAEIIGPEGLENIVSGVKFDFLFSSQNMDKTFGDNELVAHFFPGYVSKEIAFLHVPSRTFLNADLAENLPAREAFSQSGVDPVSGWKTSLFIKLFSPGNWLHNFAIWHIFGKDKTAMKRDAKIVSSWDFDRMIPCHGDVMETGAKKYWNDLYQRYLV